MVYKMSDNNCRVCGLFISDLPWGTTGKCPSYEICPCCGVEFGNEDYTVESTKRYRKRWISEGSNWFNPKEKPENWNKEEQFKNIPQAFCRVDAGE